MKKSKLYTITFLALAFMAVSCSKGFLELEPKTGQVEANYYKTEAQAFLGLTAVYDAYSVQNWQFVPVMSDIYSDDAFCGGANVNDMSQFQEIEMFNMNAENNAARDLWNRCYSGIYRANLYLEKQDGVTWITEGLKARYEAEALFLRAYFYWDLVRHYGWVPIITSVLPNVEDYKSIPQNTPNEVFTQIAKDLLKAVAVLPATITSSEKGRISKGAAQALIARIYLYHTGMSAISELGLTAQQWGDGTTVINKVYVQTALDLIITGAKYSLLTSYADLFDWTKQNNAESLLEIQYSEKAKSGDWGGWNINGNFSSVWLSVRNPVGDATVFPGWSFGQPTWSLSDEFEPGDPRKDVTLYNADVRMTSYTHAFMNTGLFNKKYMALNAYIGPGGDPNHNFARNFTDIRYADVLLMAAEVWLTDNAPKARGYFNQVRTRSLGAGAALTTVTLDNIYHERRVEFGGEGLRKWDLLRRGLTYAGTKINASFVVPGGIPNPSDFTGRTFVPGSWGMFPIPASEIRNTNAGVLKQFIPVYQ
jgi:hypothetical protein